jgi:hypothetical protein
MTRTLTDKTKSLKKRSAGQRTVTVCTLAAEEQAFRELAYRFVRCTDPAEQERLKQEIVRCVARRVRRCVEHEV